MNFIKITLIVLLALSCNVLDETQLSQITSANSAPSLSFISVWRTTTPSETITLPTRSGFNYNFTVDWGDGTSDVITAWNQAEITHTYAVAGDYTITIDGLAETWYFKNGVGNGVDKDKIIHIHSIGDLGYITMEDAFWGCTNLLTFGGGYTQNVTDMSNMFRDASAVTSLDFSSFDTSNVTNMIRMFHDASSLTSLDLSSFNTSNVTDMRGMFFKTSALTSLNVNNWDINPLPINTTIWIGSGISGGTVFCNPATLGQADFFGETCN